MLRFIKRRKAAADAPAAQPSPTNEASANNSAPGEMIAPVDDGATSPAPNTMNSPATSAIPGMISGKAAADAAPGSAEAGAQAATIDAIAGNIVQPAVEIPRPADASGANREVGANRASFIKRLASKISKTSSSLGDGLGHILLGKKEIDDELLEDIETQLLLADVGVDTTRKIIDALTVAIERDALTDSRALYKQLKAELKKTLASSHNDFIIDANCAPFVILVVGVNGAGKTTTIGKLAKRLQNNNFSVALAAGDTFRAAAVEQLQVWGERNNVPVIAQHTGADSASVIFDGLQASKAREIDVLIADTAGRLHNKDHLMEELKKVVRVIGKIDAAAPHEVLLVLDATTGQNAIAQAKKFQQAVGVTGIAITKLDGTAKGGVVFAIKDQLGLPIRFIGVGEKIEDLRPFEPDDFVEALFAGIE